jgi:hypothetical protein
MKLPIQVSSSRSRIERLSMTVLPQRRNLTWGRQDNAPRRRGVHHHTRKTTKIANNSNHARPVSWIISTPSAMSHFFHFGLDIATRRKGPA